MKTIGVFFGSRTPEHDVSIITAQLIISGLKDLGYEVWPVYIGKNGRWYIGKQLDSMMFFKEAQKEDKLNKMKEYTLDLEASSGKIVFRGRGVWRRTIAIDMAFPALHGMYGEDGTIQGLFEMVNVPYVGCGVTASAVAMDKVLTKIFYDGIGVATVPFVHFTKDEWLKNRSETEQKIMAKLRFPMMIKPAKLGSSIGISKAKKEIDLEYGIEVALHYDDRVIVEKCVENLADLTVAVIGNNDVTASLVQESLFHDELFSYEDKYLSGGGTQTGRATESIIIPARVSEAETREIQETAKKIYRTLVCEGIARVDFLYDKTEKKVYANEINTIPGTLYHHLWKKSGIELTNLLSRLIDYAQESYNKKQTLVRTFDSDILRFATSSEKLKVKS